MAQGETSGNVQYVKEMYLDCDNDTLLARLFPVDPHVIPVKKLFLCKLLERKTLRIIHTIFLRMCTILLWNAEESQRGFLHQLSVR